MADGLTQVERSSLPQQAITWTNQANAMGEIQGSIEGSQAPYLYAPFTDAVNLYNKCATMYGKLAGEADQQMQAIAAALITAAQRYDGLEQHITGLSNSATTPGHH